MLVSAGVFIATFATACLSPVTTPIPTLVQTSAPALDPDAEIRRVMDLRSDWGLESGEAWVRQVAADPAAVGSILGIPLLPDEVEQLEETFRDDPRSRLIAYGYGHPDEFGGAFVDRQGAGGFVMLFTANLEDHRSALAALPGGFPFDVRLARYPESQLKAVMDELITTLRSAAGVQFLSAGIDTIGNHVTVEAKSNDPTLESQIEATHPGMVDATVYPLPGPWQNVASGEGWRLVSAGISHTEAYKVRLATTPDEWHTMWDALDPVNAPPALDLANEVAISFAHGIGSSCPELRLDGVLIDNESRAIVSRVSDPLAPRACTADLAGSAYFVVAIERSVLTASPYTVCLTPRGQCSDLPLDLR